MNLNFMQLIDYWVGRPLCFIATILVRLCPWLVQNKKSSSAAERAIFIELSEMGAAIVAAPALRKAINKYGKANTYFMIFARNRESVDIQDIIDPENILVINDKTFWGFLVSTIKTILKVRSLGVSIAFDLELFSRCTALLVLISGAKDRVGFSSGPDEGPYRGHLFSREVRYNHHIHMSHNFLALVEAQIDQNNTQYVKTSTGPLPKLDYYNAAASTTNEVITRLSNKIGDPQSVELKNKQIILLNPDAGSLELRGWPLEMWKSLTCKLESDLPEYYTIIVGLKSYTSSADEIVNSTNKKRVFNFCGQTANLAELTALMSQSALLITCDSGPAHFASLVDLPTIALFGPETPALYKPLGDNVHVIFQGLSCSPCYSAYNHRQSDCTDNICLKSISVNRVMQEVTKVIQTVKV